MLVRWCVVVGVCLAAPIAPPPVLAQGATAVPQNPSLLPPAIQRSAHHKRLVAAYDSAADSTHLAVVTHKGKYFLTVQRPRLTWSVRYPGRAPNAQPPAIVMLEFRTQAPQVAMDSRLIVSFAGGRQFEVPSAGASSDPGVQTWSHFMRFLVPRAALVEALATDMVSVTVGGIVEQLKTDQINALRDLLARVGAWPPVHSPPGGD